MQGECHVKNRVMLPQAKEPPEAGREAGNISFPGIFRGSVTLLTPWSPISTLQSCGTIDFCCVSHLMCGSLLWRPEQNDSSIVDPEPWPTLKGSLTCCQSVCGPMGLLGALGLYWPPLPRGPPPRSEGVTGRGYESGLRSLAAHDNILVLPPLGYVSLNSSVLTLLSLFVQWTSQNSISHHSCYGD